MDPDNRSCRARLRARLAAPWAAVRARLSSERGSVLIEVMVGAVILAIATTALLDGLDGAQSTGARNKARSVAAALAEQDQERMRSLPVTELVKTIGTPVTRSVDVRGVRYTVRSIATWAPDNGGVISCSNNTRTASNVRIVSEVSSPLTRGVVDQASLVTPPPGTVAKGLGRAIVKVLDHTGAGAPNVPVSLSGTASYTASTNALGCAIFSFIPVGGYTASIANRVDWNGNSPVTASLTVQEGQSTPVERIAAAGAEIRAGFDTQVVSTVSPATAEFLTVTNSKLSVGQRIFEPIPAGTPNSLITATNLFPFVDGYDVYAGKCAANNPVGPPANNPGALQTFTPTPGQIMTLPKVRVPAINVRIIQSNGTAVTTAPFATVFVTTADVGCAATFDPQPSNSSARMSAPGFPYGTYRICAQRTTGTAPNTSTFHGHADVRNNNYAGSTTHVNELVYNINPLGNSTTTSNATAIQIRLSRSGPCE